jgi:HAD superfamily hydrolase (TIGR01509 family)
MTQNEIKAVIFDCDGTLVDSEKLSIAVLAEYVGEFGFRIAIKDALRQWAGGELPKIFSMVENSLGIKLPADHLDQFRSRQLAKLATDLEVIDGAHDLLSSMTVPFCVASNAPLNKVGLCLETTGLDKFLPESIRFSAYEIEIWKPEPDLFLLAAAKLGFEPSQCAVVEDSEYGIEAGVKAGMTTFAYDPHSELKPRDHVTTVRSLRELIPVFGG